MSNFVQTDTTTGVLLAKINCEKISEYETNVLDQEIVALGDAHNWKMGLDLSDVQMIASVGLGLLVALNRKAKTGKGKLVLYNLTEQIRHVLKLTRLDIGLTIAATRDDALKLLR